MQTAESAALDAVRQGQERLKSAGALNGPLSQAEAEPPAAPGADQPGSVALADAGVHHLKEVQAEPQALPERECATWAAAALENWECLARAAEHRAPPTEGAH